MACEDRLAGRIDDHDAVLGERGSAAMIAENADGEERAEPFVKDVHASRG